MFVELMPLLAGRTVLITVAKVDDKTIRVNVAFDVTAPVLWSPEDPNLYELRVSLQSDHGADRWSCRTGFREVATRGPDFLLNGRRLALKGVCRHEMWKEQGFTLTRQQMEQDVRGLLARPRSSPKLGRVTRMPSILSRFCWNSSAHLRASWRVSTRISVVRRARGSNEKLPTC